ncbi:MAG: TIGR00153 family protein [Pseudomonadales bacterium]
MVLSLSNLFGRSPISPIQEHMKKVCSCATRLEDFFAASKANDWDAAYTIQQDICAQEMEADNLKKSIRQHLPKSLFMPVPRSDLLQLVGMQDQIANAAKDIAGLMLGRKMRIPEPILPLVESLLTASLATCAQALTAIQELDELLETGFSGREVEAVEKLISKLDDLETYSDEIQIKLRAKLFIIEAELPPIEVMFLYKIIDLIGGLADYAQRVGSRLQILLAR